MFPVKGHAAQYIVSLLLIAIGVAVLLPTSPLYKGVSRG